MSHLVKLLYKTSNFKIVARYQETDTALITEKFSF